MPGSCCFIGTNQRRTAQVNRIFAQRQTKMTAWSKWSLSINNELGSPVQSFEVVRAASQPYSFGLAIGYTRVVRVVGFLGLSLFWIMTSNVKEHQELFLMASMCSLRVKQYIAMPKKIVLDRF
jgi:hypothetical protein